MAGSNDERDEIAGQAPVALVTGAAKRIGRTLAIRLAEQGLRVAVHCHRSIGEAERTVAEIVRRGGAAAVVEGDLADPQTPERLVRQVADRLGPPSVLVNNASIFEPESLAEVTAESFERHISVNLRAPLLLSQAVAAAAPTGQIVNIADWRGLRPTPGHLSYTLSKAGLIALTQLLALELAPRWRVNGVAPGAILPPPGKFDSHLTALHAKIPLRRHGAPELIADTVCYLLKADFTTGQIVSVTGGQEL